MYNDELPDYKQNFLREMEELRQEEARRNQPEEQSIIAQQPRRE